jgi:hypothetical protein
MQLGGLLTERRNGGRDSKGRLIKPSGEDRTAIELFIAGVRGWEGHLRRQLEDGKLNPD